MENDREKKYVYFIYDGTFAGFLTSVYEAYYSKYIPDKIIKKNDFAPGLFSRNVEIKTDKEKFDKVYTAIQQKISKQILKTVYYAFLSETADIETALYKYLKLGFKVGKKVEDFLTRPEVRKVQDYSRKVSREKHRLQGLIRFRQTEADILYAPLEPDYDIIALLSNHFKKRMTNQKWIIHDKKRSKVVLYNGEEVVITEMKKLELEYSGEEFLYQELWQEFFDTIAVKKRKNLKLQKQYMPVRYWKYLVEK